MNGHQFCDIEPDLVGWRPSLAQLLNSPNAFALIDAKTPLRKPGNLPIGKEAATETNSLGLS